nr:MAG TPA_asm: hypothetical protein [Caudoviricetes sp.]
MKRIIFHFQVNHDILKVSYFYCVRKILIKKRGI